MTLLEKVDRAADLQTLRPDELARLAREIREFLIGTVAQTGGHLGPNLGIVEVTLALHRTFHSPRDPILFDTGHQAYVHKLLTGRRAGFERLRRRGGLSGYPSRAESPHDFIENSHASTALSYADGLAKAYELRGQTDRVVVAVVGDGALTGGMAWEALNNIGSARRRIVIVLNDNGRSYCPTVGGVAAHLAELGVADPGHAATRPTLFGHLGIGYVGPVDGHDQRAVEAALRQARDAGVPTVVHCLTRKGFGYPPSELDTVDHWHASGRFDPSTGRKAPGAERPDWTSVFAQELVDLGGRRPGLVAITAAMLHPTGLAAFAAAYPERTFDVGIAEQHAVASAAGLALGGLHPVVAVYATFLNRAFDQLLMDVSLHRLAVTFVLDRAGITGDDGASHNGMWDLSMLQLVPGLRVAAPRDGDQLRSLLREAVAVTDGPTVVRFPKGPVADDLPAIDNVGGADVLRRGSRQDVLLIGVGPMAATCVGAAELIDGEGLGVTVVDPRWVVPIEPALLDLAAEHHIVAVVEDNGRVGGVGDAFARQLRERDIHVPVCTYAIPQRFFDHAKRDEILTEIGLTPHDLARDIQSRLARITASTPA